ncbi:uncharacterized protein [Eurosta solidaginis]|uniref:uncharacterized protein n=1 Tax=Eurosta solidaginis TaxID=178769 RepID=UPI003531342B
MFTSGTIQIISVLIALQAIAYVAAQNVTSKADDYVNENRRQYNATLQSFMDKIAEINKSLEDQVTALDKQKELLLKQIKETNERLEPLEHLDETSKFCVQKYKAELPYGDTVKASIESCFTNARASYASVVSELQLDYTNLLNYYNVDFQNALTSCSKSFANPSGNYTNCVLAVVSRANAYTSNYRDTFASSVQASSCTVNSRIDATVRCSSSYYNSAISSLGSVERLVTDCISGSASQAQCPTVPAGCTNVKTVVLTNADFANSTITNPFLGLSKSQGCVEIRFG